MVYIDPNVFNYTEANNAIKIADDRGTFGFNIMIGNSCIKQLPYMICQYVYPRCNSTTQALLPVCVDNCINYTVMCKDGFSKLSQMAINESNSFYEQLVINCSDQFRIFDPVTIEEEECHHFDCKLIAVT